LNNLNYYFFFFPEENPQPLDQDQITEILIKSKLGILSCIQSGNLYYFQIIYNYNYGKFPTCKNITLDPKCGIPALDYIYSFNINSESINWSNVIEIKLSSHLWIVTYLSESFIECDSLLDLFTNPNNCPINHQKGVNSCWNHFCCCNEYDFKIH
jgi:hypothetical protein